MQNARLRLTVVINATNQKEGDASFEILTRNDLMCVLDCKFKPFFANDINIRKSRYIYYRQVNEL